MLLHITDKEKSNFISNTTLDDSLGSICDKICAGNWISNIVEWDTYFIDPNTNIGIEILKKCGTYERFIISILPIIPNESIHWSVSLYLLETILAGRLAIIFHLTCGLTIRTHATTHTYSQCRKKNEKNVGKSSKSYLKFQPSCKYDELIVIDYMICSLRIKKDMSIIYKLGREDTVYKVFQHIHLYLSLDMHKVFFCLFIVLILSTIISGLTWHSSPCVSGFLHGHSSLPGC